MNESNKTLINQQIISLEIFQNNSVGSIHKKKRLQSSDFSKTIRLST